MAYKNKFVVCVIVDGNIVKELDNGQVNLPFGTEYTLRLRNKHPRRAICKLSIDGENVSSGGFIIGANSYIDIERPANIAKKFKFVSLDSEEAHDFGKNGPNPNKTKGTIVAEFALELGCDPYGGCQPVPMSKWEWDWQKYRYDKLAVDPTKKSYLRATNHTFDDKMIKYGAGYQANEIKALSFSSTSSCCSLDLQDGATVEGSKSSQSFTHQYFIDDGEWTTVRVFLQGYDKENRAKNRAEFGQEDLELELLEKKVKKLKEEKLKRALKAEEELEQKKIKLREEIKQLEAELGG